MYIDNFVSNENTISNIKEKILSNKLGHAVLIFAKEGYGVNHFAKLLAADILDVDKHQFYQIENQTHQQLQFIKGSGASGQIKVDSVREIKHNVDFSLIGGSKRVIIIQDCENFNVSSANAILKNLEEPKSDITYILTSKQPSKILATIRSRCEIYTLQQPTQQECLKYFEKENKEVLSNLMQIYNANIGLIKKCIESPKRMQILQIAIQAYKMISVKKIYELAKQLYEYNRRKEDFLLFLDDIQKIAANNLNDVSVCVVNAVLQSKNAISQNANLSLVIEDFIISVH